MKTHVLLLLMLGMVLPVRGDYFPPPFQSVAVSPNSDYLVRVDVRRPVKNDNRLTDDWVSVHRYDLEKHTYVKVAEFPYGEWPGSGFLFISNDGQYVAGVNVSGLMGGDKMGIRLYNQAGQLLKFWPITDFLKKEEIAKLGGTTTTLQWFKSGGFDHDTKQFNFISPGERFFMIDLKKLELKVRP